MSHGVRKINEYIIRDGRAIILTQRPGNDITIERWNGIQDGTVLVDPNLGMLKYKKRNSAINIWTNFDPIDVFNNKSIIESLLADKCITNSKMNSNSITIDNDALSDGVVTKDKIALRSITENKLLESSFTGNIFLEEGIDGSKLKQRTLNGNRIILKSIKTSEIDDRAITSDKMAKSSITVLNEALDDKVVQTTKIDDKAITNIKMAKSSITVLNEALDDKVVQTAKIDDNAITSDKMAKASITILNEALDDKVVQTTKIDDNAVTNTKMAKSSITILNEALDDRVVTTSKIALNTIIRENLNKSLTDLLDTAVYTKDGETKIEGNLQVSGNISGPEIIAEGQEMPSITGFRVYNPIFKDYAEAFKTNDILQCGDIVEIDYNDYVKKSEYHSKKIIGVISDQYSMCLGASEEELKNGEKVAIGLLGRLKINIVGQVEIGDFIVSCGCGVGVASKKFIGGSIIGKALQKKSSYGIEPILCIIQPM